MQREFIIHSDHLALKQLNTPITTNRHARWYAYLQRFVFTIQHRPGEKNKVAGALSRRAHTLTVLQVSVPALDCVKELYSEDEDFKVEWTKCWSGKKDSRFNLQEGFLFFDNRPCIPRSSIRLKLTKPFSSLNLDTIGPKGCHQICTTLPDLPSFRGDSTKLGIVYATACA